jgi:hypothetical protein
MSSWFDKFRPITDSTDVAAYKAIRAAGISWFPKIMAHPASKDFDLVKAAKKVGIPVVDNTIVFDDECETAVLMDYFLFDYRPKDKSVAESCVFAPGELTPLEAEMHEANLASHTSLYEVTHAHNSEPKILLHDRLNKDAPDLWLIDLGLSNSFRRLGGKVLLFTRVVSLHGLHMTGGFSFVFETKHEFALVDGYHRAMWSVPPTRQDRRRTHWFLGFNRRFGLGQAYADVVPSASDGVT